MKTILIVEDVELNRDLLVQLLEDDYSLVLAADGQAALQKAEETKPDLILMDLSLPRMDGWEATRRLKAHPKTRDIPVIALTGHVIERSRERAIEAGADGYLTKPCFPDSLLAEVHRVMKQPRRH
jgi:CheY-like chemotaxis protein